MDDRLRLAPVANIVLDGISKDKKIRIKKNQEHSFYFKLYV